MRNTRKGFTLIELLIVVTIMAALTAMMAVSSSDAIDKANANAILGNLQSMKVEAYDMYLNVPEVAALTAISGNTQAVTLTGATSATDVGTVLGERLGRKDIATNYSIVGDASHWYVVYTFTTNDSAQVKTLLKNKAEQAGLYGGTSAAVA